MFDKSEKKIVDYFGLTIFNESDMLNKISAVYTRYLNIFWLQVLISGGLGSIIYVARQYPQNVIANSIGISATVLLAVHAYFISVATKMKMKELDFWKRELDGHKWLLNTIQEMIARKLHKFKNNEYPVDESEYRNAVMKNLDMLREFYVHYCGDPGNFFRVTLFQISDDGKYLVSKFYSTKDGEPHSSHGDEVRQRENFNKSRSQTSAVSSWRELRPIISENEEEISYLYPQQRDKIKSIIALPIFSGDISDDNLIGIITVASNKEYFKRADMERHKEYIEQFTLRIIFEYCKWQACKKIEKNK